MPPPGCGLGYVTYLRAAVSPCANEDERGAYFRVCVGIKPALVSVKCLEQYLACHEPSTNIAYYCFSNSSLRLVSQKFYLQPPT